MKIKASTKYQLHDATRSVIVYYIVIAAIMVVFNVAMLIISNIYKHNVYGTIGSFESASAIFLFVVGLCSFKDSFLMLVQNGSSRRSLFWGRAVSFVAIAGVMAVADKLVQFVQMGISQLISGMYSLSMFNMGYRGSGVLHHVTEVFYLFAAYMACLAVGYFVTALFYRLNRGGKVLVGVGVPVLIVIVYPLADALLFRGAISNALDRFFDFALGLSSNQPWMAVLTFLVTSALFGLFGWLLIRRARVK